MPLYMYTNIYSVYMFTNCNGQDADWFSIAMRKELEQGSMFVAATELTVKEPRGWRALEGQTAIQALHRTEEWREHYRAVQQDGLALKNAPEDLRCDKELVAEACWANGLALQHAPDFKDDWEVVMCAVSKNGTALMWASSVLQADKEVVLRAVKENGGALAYASQDLRSDRDVVLAAVQQRGMALRYAGEDLKGDREVVKAAARQSKRALMYASDFLRKDAAFIQDASTQARPAEPLERTVDVVPPSYGPGL